MRRLFPILSFVVVDSIDFTLLVIVRLNEIISFGVSLPPSSGSRKGSLLGFSFARARCWTSPGFSPFPNRRPTPRIFLPLRRSSAPPTPGVRHLSLALFSYLRTVRFTPSSTPQFVLTNGTIAAISSFLLRPLQCRFPQTVSRARDSAASCELAFPLAGLRARDFLSFSTLPRPRSFRCV